MKPVFIEFDLKDGTKMLFNVAHIEGISAPGDLATEKALVYINGNGIALDITYEDAVYRLRDILDKK